MSKEAMTPTLAEIEARHAKTEEWIVKPVTSAVSVVTARSIHDDRAALLRMVRSRDARLAEIAREAKEYLDDYDGREPHMQRIHAIATKEGA